jgi:NAD+-dependent protein deacetylase sirtuin 5
MHGRLVDTICTDCNHIETNTVDESLCLALAAAGAPSIEGATESRDTVAHISVDDLPHCQACGGLLRPRVVWFGEVPLHWDEIYKLVGEADMCLVVGTSSTVCCERFLSAPALIY